MTAILQATTPPSALVEGLARTPVRLAALVEGVTEAALDAAPAGSGPRAPSSPTSATTSSW